jgi:chromosome segregation ATPase
MTHVGRPIPLTFVALFGLAITGTAGATLAYQHSAAQVEAENAALETRIDRLQSDLETTRSDLQRARERAERLNDTLETRQADVEKTTRLLDETRATLEATEGRLIRVRDRLAAKNATLDAVRVDLKRARFNLKRAKQRVDYLETQRIPSLKTEVAEAEREADEARRTITAVKRDRNRQARRADRNADIATDWRRAYREANEACTNAPNCSVSVPTP